MSKISVIAKKELTSYFTSPTAYIFLGIYLAVSLFTFFWVEKFFARNLADLRPLFEWMPLLLIFLIGALTMKMWSEERRMGTIEFLLTMPIKTHELVLGKFLACMGLVSVALVLTFGIAFTVGILGDLDLGPATGAYLAAFLLAAAYTAIGLFVSSRTDSQIISLSATVVICLGFYLAGHDVIVGFLGNRSGEIMKLFGSGSRFSSIARGVIDLRDIYYYISIALVFLVGNVFALERLKWSTEASKPKYTQFKGWFALAVVNLVFANIWLYKVQSIRLDLTRDKIYSISSATRDVINQLQEPLLIRGYFSERTHPLLAPLVPTIRDLLREYELAGGGRIRAEFIDPRENPKLEEEANRAYHIEPVTFPLGDRHSTSLVNSYFNILIEYGNQHEVLGYNDLIAAKQDGMGSIDVRLKSLEYDLTRTIKKTMQSYRTTDNFYADLKGDVKFVGYVSEGGLPEPLKKLSGEIKTAIEEYKKASGGKLTAEFHDPSQDKALATQIAQQYGFGPQGMGDLGNFYFYLILQHDDKTYAIGVPEDLSVAGFKRNMDSTLKRLAPGFLRTVGIVTPPVPEQNPMMAQFGGASPSGPQFRMLNQKLEENYTTSPVQLDSGVVPGNIDILLVLAPKALNEKQQFAIDQFLMKGGTVILSTSPVGVRREGQAFTSEAYDSGLETWLSGYGVTIPHELVLDEKNTGFPALRKRSVGGTVIREPYLAPYPFFVNVTQGGLNKDNGITSDLNQVTMAWASPIDIDAAKNKDRTVVPLIKSSTHSWRATDISIEPNPQQYPELGFAVGEKQQPSTLAVMIEGRFDSAFKGKESPLWKKAVPPKTDKNVPPVPDAKADEPAVVSGVIDRSPNIARLIVFATNQFITDETLQISGMMGGTQYVNPLQTVENAVDWSTSDRTLLSIRSHGHFAHTLEPLSEAQKRNWEYANYVLALLGLGVVFGVARMQKRRRLEHFKAMILASGAGHV